MLLVLLAVCSVTLLSLAAVQVAIASPAQPPLILPDDAGASAAAPGTESGRWIVGGIPGRATDRIANSLGASGVDQRLGSYRVPRAEARRFADRLEEAGRLVYAEPDLPLTRSSYPLDLLSGQQWWLERIVNPGDVTPPRVRRNSPMIALVEESLDPRHPDLATANLTGSRSLGPEADWHGTAIAGIIGSPGEMRGIRGVWPGARMRLFASGLTCSTASKAVTRAARKGAAVINMSYTFPANACYTHLVATQFAIKKHAVLVAAAGNSGASGNSAMRPASDPHVISVGAVDDALNVAPFSTRNAGVDITAPGAGSAPGDGVLAPYVTQGSDGARSVEWTWRNLSGTSFAAAMVSAAAAWLRQDRPRLGNLQIAGLLTRGATDLGEPGRDPKSGEGLLNIEQSLAEPNPPADPFEPNDDIRWLDGSRFRGKGKFLWRERFGKRRRITATLSRAKDPADVYRVLIPPRSRIVVNVSQLEGNVVLAALKPKAKRIARPRKHLIVRSNRPAPKTEGIVVRNLKRRAQSIWVAITTSRKHPGNEAHYRIKVARRR